MACPLASLLALPSTPVGGDHRALIGRTIDEKYCPTAILGEGGMGTVYEAQHLLMERSVALKVLHPLFASDPDVVRRFQQEAQAAGSIGHPNICEIYDAGQLDDGSPYLVMKRLLGETLADRLEREKVLPVALMVDIASQVLSALGAAHEKGIVHRDIKPDNIFLVERAGFGPMVKLLDFGISKNVANEGLHLTRTGVVMGTPYYMAPEQARGEFVDARIDLYAVGAVLYESSTGRRPFDSDDLAELLRLVLFETPRPPRELRPSLPETFALVVERAIAKDRTERYQTAQEFMVALSTLRAETEAYRVGTSEPERSRWGQRVELLPPRPLANRWPSAPPTAPAASSGVPKPWRARPSVASERPPSTSATSERPLRPSATPERPLRPSAAPERPLRPSAAPERPLRPSAAPERPLRPSAAPERPPPAFSVERPPRAFSAERPPRAFPAAERPPRAFPAAERPLRVQAGVAEKLLRARAYPAASAVVSSTIPPPPPVPAAVSSMLPPPPPFEVEVEAAAPSTIPPPPFEAAAVPSTVPPPPFEAATVPSTIPPPTLVGATVPSTLPPPTLVGATVPSTVPPPTLVGATVPSTLPPPPGRAVLSTLPPAPIARVPSTLPPAPALRAAPSTLPPAPDRRSDRSTPTFAQRSGKREPTPQGPLIVVIPPSPPLPTSLSNLAPGLGAGTPYRPQRAFLPPPPQRPLTPQGQPRAGSEPNFLDAGSISLPRFSKLGTPSAPSASSKEGPGPVPSAAHRGQRPSQPPQPPQPLQLSASSASRQGNEKANVAFVHPNVPRLRSSEDHDDDDEGAFPAVPPGVFKGRFLERSRPLA